MFDSQIGFFESMGFQEEKPGKSYERCKISVIVPVLDEQEYIISHISHIRQQDFEGALEIIVVDGDCDGRTLEVIEDSDTDRNENAFDIDKLPEFYLGTATTFLWYIIKPFLIFSFTMTIVQMPFILGLIFLKNYGVTLTNIWTLDLGLNTVLQVLFAFGMFIFPIAVLSIAVGEDITLLRIDYFAKPIKKATIPYMTTFILMLILGAAVIITFPMQYDIEITTPINALYLTANIAVQLIAIFTMRSIALFYRHYNCYMKW